MRVPSFRRNSSYQTAFPSKAIILRKDTLLRAYNVPTSNSFVEIDTMFS